MDSTRDFLNLFVNDIGEFFYFIAIFIIYQAALLMAFGQRARSVEEWTAGRYAIALTTVVVAWLGLMLGALVSIANERLNVLPPLERSVHVIMLIWLAWAFLTAESKTATQYTRAALWGTILTILGGAVSLALWDNATPFYEQGLAAVWTLLPLLLVMGTIFLIINRAFSVADIPLKLVFLLLIGVGHGYGLYLFGQNNDEFVGTIRWAFIASSGLVLVIVYRMVIERMRMAIEEVAVYAETISKPMPAIILPEKSPPTPPVLANSAALEMALPRPAIDPNTLNEVISISDKVKGQTPGTASLGGRNQAMELLKALGIMLDDPNTDTLPRQIVYAVSQSFKADVVAIMISNQHQWAQIIFAYDQIQDHRIENMLMHLARQPILIESFQANRPHMLDMEKHEESLRDLFKRLDVGPIGPVYLQPLARDRKVVGILLLGFPYTHLQMRPDDILLLESIAPVAARLLVISRNAIQQRTEAEERAIQAIVDSEIDELAEETRTAKEVLQANLEQAQIQIRELNKLVKALEADADKERQRVAELLQDSEEAMSITQRIETISAERSQLRAERENLANALIEAKASLVTATAEDDVLVFQGMIEELQREVDELTQQKHALEERLVRIREADDTSQASQKLNALIESLTAEKAQLATDRDLLQNQLRQTRAQLESLGIEDGVVGLAKQLAHLTEERLYYKAQAEKATQEREVLLAERRKLEEAIAAETKRSARIRTLEEEVARLGQDREALIKSRDSLKIEREAFLAERDMWRGERARLLAQTDALRMELDETLDLLRQANEERQENNARIHELTAEFDNLRATRTRVENERDALLARIQGDRERLKEVGAEGVGALTKIIEELSQERKTLEDKLSQMQAELNNLKWETIKLREVQPDQLQSGSVDAGTINTMAQELIAPISAISHYADMLLGESVGGLSALQHQFMMRVKSNLERLNQLIGDLVQASSLLYKGALELKPQPLNLLDLIDDAITDSRFKFSEKGIILDLDIPDEVLQVEADSAAMRQVIRHLIDNAYLVSPNDSSVRLSAHYHNNGQQQVLVAISDHGGGVDPALHEQVFSQMNRADNTIIKGVGHSGIELSLVKGLIEAHNGKIWLETEVGIGTTFSFTVPTRFEE